MTERTCALCGATKPFTELTRSGMVVWTDGYRDHGAVRYECKDTAMCLWTKETFRAMKSMNP